MNGFFLFFCEIDRIFAEPFSLNCNLIFFKYIYNGKLSAYMVLVVYLLSNAND